MKIKFINITDINENEQNKVFTMGNLDDILASIKTYGLKEPLSVCALEDGKYKLISGHRRLSCIKQILSSAENASYRFMDKILTDVVPCIEEKSFADKDEEFLNLMSSNKYRKLTPEETKSVILRCKEIFDRKLQNGEISIEGTTTRDVIAKMACVSGKTVDKYLKESNDYEIEDKSKTKSVSSVLKTIDKYKEYLNELDLEEYGKTDRNTIKEALNELSVLCKKKK